MNDQFLYGNIHYAVPPENHVRFCCVLLVFFIFILFLIESVLKHNFIFGFFFVKMFSGGQSGRFTFTYEHNLNDKMYEVKI